MNADRSDLAFATFRVSGDALIPSEVTALLGLKPSLSYRKGETYLAGERRKREYVGRTGVWYVSTDTLLTSPDLEDHLSFLTFILSSRAKTDRVRTMVMNGAWEVSASCFWAGAPGSAAPEILPAFRLLVEELGGRLEVDFERDAAIPDRVYVG